MDLSVHTELLPYRQHAVKGFVAISAADALSWRGYVANMVTGIRGRKPPRVFLDEWMAYRGMTNADLARRIGIDRSTVGKWREKLLRLDVGQLTALAGALDIEFNDLFRLPPEKNGPPPKPSVDQIIKNLPDELQDTVINLATTLAKRAS